MLCTTAVNTSNRIRTQTDTAERKSTGLDTNSCLFDSDRCTYYLFRLHTYHEGKLADVHSPPIHPTKVAVKKNIITRPIMLQTCFSCSSS